MTGLVAALALADLNNALNWLNEHWIGLSIGLGIYFGIMICAVIGWRAAR